MRRVGQVSPQGMYFNWQRHRSLVNKLSYVNYVILPLLFFLYVIKIGATNKCHSEKYVCVS